MSRLARSHIARGAGPFAACGCCIWEYYYNALRYIKCIYTVIIYLSTGAYILYRHTRVAYLPTYLPIRKHGCGERKSAELKKINKIPTVNIRISNNMT